MKRLTGVLTAVLLMAVITTGCSSGSDEPEVPTPQHKVTKENIVGVWRSGDYWVSFSESGYASLYFDVEGDERILEGDYSVDNDTITITHTLYFGETRLTLGTVSANSLVLNVLYSYYPFTLFDKDETVTKIHLILTKSSEQPTEKNPGLDGFVFSNDITCEENGESYLITQTNTIHEDYHYISYVNDYHGNQPPSYKDGWYDRGKKYYVYLSQNIYVATCNSSDAYKRNTPIEKYVIQFQ